MVGNEEIKLEIFADDMSAFLRDHASLDTLLNMVDSFSLHSRLKINFEKTEVLFLGNDQESTMETVISLARNRNIKKLSRFWEFTLYMIRFCGES